MQRLSRQAKRPPQAWRCDLSACSLSLCLNYKLPAHKPAFPLNPGCEQPRDRWYTAALLPGTASHLPRRARTSRRPEMPQSPQLSEAPVPSGALLPPAPTRKAQAHQEPRAVRPGAVWPFSGGFLPPPHLWWPFPPARRGALAGRGGGRGAPRGSPAFPAGRCQAPVLPPQASLWSQPRLLCSSLTDWFLPSPGPIHLVHPPASPPSPRGNIEAGAGRAGSWETAQLSWLPSASAPVPVPSPMAQECSGVWEGDGGPPRREEGEEAAPSRQCLSSK